MLEAVLGTRAKVRMLRALATAGHPLTRHELARAARSGMRSTYEQVEELLALGVVREVAGPRTRVELDPEFPLHDELRGLLLSEGDLLGTAGDILAAVDRICGDGYYIGAFTAARARITPVDYDPPFYLVNVLEAGWARLCPRLRALGRLDNVRVGEDGTDGTGDVTLILASCSKIPSDAARTQVRGADVWLCSAERGIVECLARKTPFSEYGAYLALLQNRVDGVLDVKRLCNLANEENVLPRLLAVTAALDRAAGKTLFGLGKIIARGEKGAVNEKEIQNAVNTVMG
jgi:hypothetical protein